MDTRLPAVAAECSDNLHDRACWQQTPEGLGIRSAEPVVVADLDCGECRMGAAADEPCSLGGVRQKPSEMEQVIFAEAIWRAFAQCFLTHDEAVQAIDDYWRGLLHNAELSGREAIRS